VKPQVKVVFIKIVAQNNALSIPECGFIKNVRRQFCHLWNFRSL